MCQRGEHAALVSRIRRPEVGIEVAEDRAHVA
jgi:hypothetical protein